MKTLLRAYDAGRVPTYFDLLNRGADARYMEFGVRPVESSFVCMMNDRLFPTEQIPVTVDAQLPDEPHHTSHLGHH